MMRRRAFIGTSACAALLATLAVARTAPPSRTYDLSWKVTVDSIPAGIREAKVWVALPQELPEQQVSGLELTTQRRWKLVEDPTFHNRVALLVIPKPPAELSIAFKASVTREPVLEPRPAVLTGKERALFLRREALVSLSPRIRALADSVGGTNRSRYDYVLSTMVYDKTAPGWGHGDSERACDVHRGNCTDFHSLFMSLSRAEGVPAVFEMGYATLPEGETDHPGGYHCWAWFYDDFSQAWSPVDISEADQHPERADFCYGHLDADRITFSRGRDIKLPGMKGDPLNYLPSSAYVELDGRPLTRGVTRWISYSVKTSAISAAE